MIRNSQKKPVMTREEAEDIINQIRRGVPLGEIAEVRVMPPHVLSRVLGQFGFSPAMEIKVAEHKKRVGLL